MRSRLTLLIGLVLVVMVASLAPAGATKPLEFKMQALIRAEWSSPEHCVEGTDGPGLFTAWGWRSQEPSQ